MPVTDKTIQEDINRATNEYRICDTVMLDGKIKAVYIIEKNYGNQWQDQAELDEKDQYSFKRIEKVFDGWKDFTDYSEVFFKNQK